MVAVQFIIIIALIACSAFFSSAETAYTTLNKIHLSSLVKSGDHKALKTAKILEDPSRMLSAILIGNNIVNISVSAITTTMVLSLWGDGATGISTVILTVALLIFGEITPKTLAARNPEKIALMYSSVIQVIIAVLTPVAFVINKLSLMFLKLFKNNENDSNVSLTEADIRAIVAVSHEEGVIESSEKKIINNLFDFGDAFAKDVMIPHIDVDTLSCDASYEEVMTAFKRSGHSRIPVYENNPDNIVGILYGKDLLYSVFDKEHSGDLKFNIKRLMRAPYFTFETKNTSVLFKDMQKKKTSVAIVLDEYGSFAGMITTQDLIEEIIGEIHDEYDEYDNEPFIKLSDKKFKVEGSYKLDDINDELETHLSSNENDSIGGLIIENLDRFPKSGDLIETDELKATVIKTTGNRIDYVLIELK